VAWPFQLYALEPMSGLVHLKKDHHRNAADHVMGERDIDVAVSKVESSR
jgi:hypothetical protein